VPGLAQVVGLECRWREHETLRECIHSGITSLPPTRATPAKLLALKRRHWSIENRLHLQKDVTFGEDASLIHARHGPTVVAPLRDAALNVLSRASASRVTTMSIWNEPSQLLIDPPPAHA
jgi:hypothetical protein